VWDGSYERDIEKLEKIQLEAARIVTGLTKFASKDSLYFETEWETLANRRETRKLTTFYKLCPPYLSFTLFLNEDNVGEFLIDMSKLLQCETVDGINELADVLSLYLGGT
jgi:hypothetical protein